MQNFDNKMRIAAKIEEIAELMTIVFKQIYDGLFEEKAMDISADISVMKTVINDFDILKYKNQHTEKTPSKRENQVVKIKIKRRKPHRR